MLTIQEAGIGLRLSLSRPLAVIATTTIAAISTTTIATTISTAITTTTTILGLSLSLPLPDMAAIAQSVAAIAEPGIAKAKSVAWKIEE